MGREPCFSEAWSRLLGKVSTSDVIFFGPLLNWRAKSPIGSDVHSVAEVVFRCDRCIWESIPWSLAAVEVVSSTWKGPFHRSSRLVALPIYPVSRRDERTGLK